MFLCRATCFCVGAHGVCPHVQKQVSNPFNRFEGLTPFGLLLSAVWKLPRQSGEYTQVNIEYGRLKCFEFTLSRGLSNETIGFLNFSTEGGFRE